MAESRLVGYEGLLSSFLTSVSLSLLHPLCNHIKHDILLLKILQWILIFLRIKPKLFSLHGLALICRPSLSIN